jgi:transcription antitermination protein NusB
MSRRSRAREVALQSLYQAELNATVDPRDRARFHKGRLRSAPLVEFADALVDGVRGRQPELDALIDARSANWRVARMAATDRIVLRIAAFELQHTDTPGAVVVDEAIELARRYGSAASPTFVAGILGGLLADRDGSPRPSVPAGG